MKKLAAILLVLIIMAGMWTVSADTIPGEQQNQLSNFVKTRAYESAFSDIGGHWAEDYISNAYEYGIISGIGFDLYDPGGNLTVAQAITIGARLHSTYKYSDAGQSVLDEYAASADPEHWAAPFIAYAEGEGIIDGGWSDSLDRPVTRAETVYLWSLILTPEDMAPLNSVHSLPDVGLSTQYFDEITLFYEAGIVQGSTINNVENSFNPGGTLRRAEAAAIFMLLVEPDKRMSGRKYGGETVRVFAGTGTSGFSNEAAAPSFTLPYGLTADRGGNIVVFDTYNNAIRRIAEGRVGTIAGQWLSGGGSRFSRGAYKDGALSAALFNRPSGGVYNADGDLFICDSENHVIRMIRDGKVYTHAGTTQGHANGAGNVAKFDTPMAMAIDKSGTLYVADTMNNCIRKIDSKGYVTTIAGVPGDGGYKDGSASVALFRDPSGIAVSANGTIYIADTGNHRIRKIENGNVTTLCGVTPETDEDGDPMGGYQDGAAGAAMFNLPKGITLAEDILFVADSGNNVIRAVNMNGRAYTAAGTGEPGDRAGGMLSAEFNQPAGVLWHNGTLYIADTSNNRIKTLTVDISIFR